MEARLLKVQELKNIVSEVETKKKGNEGKNGSVPNGTLVWGGVLDDFGAEIRALDGPQMLLVRLAVCRVLVEHVRRASLDLGVEDSKPQLLSLDDLLKK